MCNENACTPPNGRRLRKSETWVADSGLDTVELNCLALARHFILGMEYPEDPRILAQFEKAAERFGPRDAHAVSYAVCDLIRAIRQSRRSTFMFSNPNCRICQTILTAPERHLILALAAARQGRRGTAAVHVMLLCEGQPDQEVNTILRALAAMLPVAQKPAKPIRPSRMKWSTPK